MTNEEEIEIKEDILKLINKDIKEFKEASEDDKKKGRDYPEMYNAGVARGLEIAKEIINGNWITY